MERERRFDRAGDPAPDASLGLLQVTDWSGKGDSNSRPSPWQGDALPLSYSRLIGTAERARWRPIGGSNPCSRRERAVSWTTRRMGRKIFFSRRWSGKGDSTGLAFQILTRALALLPHRWSGKGDSNSRPSPWQGDALPLSYSRLSRTTISLSTGALDDSLLQPKKWRPIGGSNPCSRRERAVSWTTRRMGRMERETRFELATLALARRCSTTELFPHYGYLMSRVASHRGFEPLFPP